MLQELTSRKSVPRSISILTIVLDRSVLTAKSRYLATRSSSSRIPRRRALMAKKAAHRREVCSKGAVLCDRHPQWRNRRIAPHAGGQEEGRRKKECVESSFEQLTDEPRAGIEADSNDRPKPIFHPLSGVIRLGAKRRFVGCILGLADAGIWRMLNPWRESRL